MKYFIIITKSVHMNKFNINSTKNPLLENIFNE